MNISGFGLNVYLTQFIYSAIEVPGKLMVYFLLRVIGRRTCQAGTLLVTGTCIAINIFLPPGLKSAFKIVLHFKIPFQFFFHADAFALLLDLWHLRAVVAIIGKGFSEAAFTTVSLYTTELYPTVIRSAITLSDALCSAFRLHLKCTEWAGAHPENGHLLTTLFFGLTRQNALGYSNFMSRLGVSMAPLVLLLEDFWTLLPQIIICSVAIFSGISCLLLPETRNVRLPESIDDIEMPRFVDLYT